jgi:hypothetical protein
MLAFFAHIPPFQNRPAGCHYPHRITAGMCIYAEKGMTARVPLGGIRALKGVTH